MSVRLKQHVWGLVAVVALSIVTLVVLSGMAEAQEEHDAHAVRVETTQNADRNDAALEAEKAAATATPREDAYEPTERLVVEPGDSLWSIAQRQLGPDVPPPEVANQVELIFGLNRNAIGDDPDLIFAGQEFSLPPIEGSTAAEPAAYEPATATDATPESAAEPLPEPIPHPASSGTQAAPAPSSEAVEPSPPTANANEHGIAVLGRAHWLLGVWILFLAAILTLFMAWKAFTIERSLRRNPKLRYHASSVEPGVSESETQFPILQAIASNRSPGDLQSTTTVEENGHHYCAGATEVARIKRKGVFGPSKRRWRKFLHEERATVVRGRQVRRFMRYAPLRGAAATNGRATGATLEASRLSGTRKKKMRAAALAGSFVGSGRTATVKGEQGSHGRPRKDFRDLEKKAGG